MPTDAGKDGKGKTSDVKPEDKPFELKNLELKIPKGAFVAIVGRVGSGKVCAEGEYVWYASSKISRVRCSKL